MNRREWATRACRPSAFLLPYVDLGAMFDLEGSGNGRFHISGGVILSAKRRGVFLDLAYRDGFTPGLGYMAAW